MDLRAPERLVGVDVADAGHERLVDEERLEPAAPGADPLPEDAEREPVVQRLGADVVERVVVGRVQPDAPELADVAEAQLAAVVERQREALVRIQRAGRRHHEQLAGHLEVDREERAGVEVDDHLLAPPPDRLDPTARDPRDEPCRVLVPQRARPGDAGAGDPRPGSVAVGQQVAAQVARDGLDLGQLGHAATLGLRPPNAVRYSELAQQLGMLHHGRMTADIGYGTSTRSTGGCSNTP